MGKLFKENDYKCYKQAGNNANLYSTIVPDLIVEPIKGYSSIKGSVFK
jgi:hypothetical protein